LDSNLVVVTKEEGLVPSGTLLTSFLGGKGRELAGLLVPMPYAPLTDTVASDVNARVIRRVQKKIFTAGDDAVESDPDPASLPERYFRLGWPVRDCVQHPSGDFDFCSHRFSSRNGFKPVLLSWPRALYKFLTKPASLETACQLVHEFRHLEPTVFADVTDVMQQYLLESGVDIQYGLDPDVRLEFDSTLGYPGEGPLLLLIALVCGLGTQTNLAMAWAGPIVEDLATGELLPVLESGAGAAGTLVTRTGSTLLPFLGGAAAGELFSLKDVTHLGKSIVRTVKRLTGKHRKRAAKRLATTATLPVLATRRTPGYGMNTRINTRGRRRRNGAGSHAFRATRVEEIVMITSSDDPDVTIIPISPRSPEMSRFLRDIAPNWTKYSVNALRLEYAPLGGDDVAGRFSVGFVYDPTLPAPHNIAELVSSTTQKWRSYNAAFSEAAAVGQFKKDLYVNPDSESLHWTEAGYIVLISQDGPTADNGEKRGVLTVSYDITLMDYAPLEEFHPGQGFVNVTAGTEPNITTDTNVVGKSGYDVTTYGDIGIVRALHPVTGDMENFLSIPAEGVYKLSVAVLGAAGNTFTLGSSPVANVTGVWQTYPGMGTSIGFELAALPDVFATPQYKGAGLADFCLTECLIKTTRSNVLLFPSFDSAVTGQFSSDEASGVSISIVGYSDIAGVFDEEMLEVTEARVGRLMAIGDQSSHMGAVSANHGRETGLALTGRRKRRERRLMRGAPPSHKDGAESDASWRT
jgi:hypothetical protein